MMRKKKRRILGGVLLGLLILALGLGALGWVAYNRYTRIDGELIPRDTEELDLRGKDVTAEDLASAREALPDAHILYDVTIAGKTYSCDEKEIVTGDLTMADIPLFSQFEGLVFVDASACSELDVIYALREALAPAEVVWSVPLAGGTVPGEETALALQTVGADELTAALRRLPEVKTVTVEEACLTAEEQTALAGEFSGVAFTWPVQIPGGSVSTDTKELSFAGKTLTADGFSALESAIALLPALEKIDFTGTELADETLIDFAARH
ncbi:MAG: hypothetical protein J6P58_06870, partial [Oscillospiraceae bacterium]|nr:hypothetical protein [Oscillospiraceae bacterium]